MSIIGRIAGAVCAIFYCAAAAAAATAADAFVKDPGFNGGAYFVDAFGASPGRSYDGEKLVRLDNGDVVVAGIVPALRGGNQGNLGLVRYDSQGRRVAWSSPGDVGWYGNQYVVYNLNCLVPYDIDAVKAIAAYGNYLFVLVDGRGFGLAGNPPQASFRAYTSDVLVFGTDGHFVGLTEVGEGDAASTAPRDFTGGGIAVYEDRLVLGSPVSLVFAGTRIEDGYGRALFRRFVVGADGSLSGGTGLVTIDEPVACSIRQPGCEISALALGGRTLGGPPRIYLGGSYATNQLGLDFLVMMVDTSGALTGFELRGFGFNIAGTSMDERGRDLFVVSGGVTSNEDDIYIAGDIPGKCGNGMGVARFKGDGQIDTAFGLDGLGAIGFGTAGGSICVIPRTDYAMREIAVTAQDIVFVGQRTRGAPFGSDPGTEPSVDAVFARLSPDGHDLTFFDVFAYADAPNGPRTRHSALSGVLANPDGTFTATGNVRFLADADPSLAGRTQYATLRFIGEHIFANGFENP